MIPARRAFSLIELVVVIGIIGVLMGLILPAIQRVRKTTARTQCLNRLHQLALALHQYNDANGSLPPGITGDRDRLFPSMAWPARLLPYIEQSALWEDARRDYANQHSPFVPRQHSGLSAVVGTFHCPSDPRIDSAQDTHNGFRVAMTSFVGNLGLDYESKDGVLMLDSKVKLTDISDGTSGTLLVGERPPSDDFWYGWWYAGHGQASTGSVDMLIGARERNLGQDLVGFCPKGPFHFVSGSLGTYCDVLHYWSLHPGGANFAFCDGSVRFLAYSADPIMPALATRAGGESVQPPG